MAIDDQIGAPAAWQLNDPAVLTARRQYVTAVVRQRLHQRGFRRRVLRAYQQCCAICRLRHEVTVRLDVLEEIDGLMLQHGLQGFQGRPLLIALTDALVRAAKQPTLAELYRLFQLLSAEAIRIRRNYGGSFGARALKDLVVVAVDFVTREKPLPAR